MSARVLVDEVMHDPVITKLMGREEIASYMDDPAEEHAHFCLAHRTVRYDRRFADGTFEIKVKTTRHLVGHQPFRKAYSRWATSRVELYTMRDDGTCLYRKLTSNGRWSSRIMLSDDTTHVYGMPDAVKACLTTSFSDYYPLIRTEDTDTRFIRETFMTTRGGFRKAFVGCTDVTELTVRLFGVSRVRRDLIKAVAQRMKRGCYSDIVTLYTAWQFRGLVPIDWIVTFLHREDEPGHILSTAVHIRSTIRHLDQRSLRRLLTRTQVWHNLDARHLPDKVAVPARVDSAESLHEQMWAVYNRERRDAEAKQSRELLAKRKPVIDKHQRQFDGTTDAGLRVVTATDPQQLIDWGEVMNNCIAGSARNIGDRVYLAAYRGNTLVANIELSSDHTVLQLLGKRNAHLRDADRTDLEHYLAERGVDVNVRYWGAAAA